MPLKIRIEKDIIIDESWFSEDDLDEIFKLNEKELRDVVIEVLSDDIYSLLNEMGGLHNSLKSINRVSE